MVECDFCEEEFDDKTELHLHWEEEHEDELNSHQEEKVKKAKREKKKREQQKKAQYKQYSYYAISIIALVGLVAGAYVFMPKGAVLSGSGNQNIGPAGSAHTHADFMVVVNGEPIDFAKRKYMVVSNKAHIEAMNGDVVHGHATGATFKFFLNSLGFDYNATYLKTPSQTYYENGKEVRMFIETGGDWREIEPKAFEFSSGDRILLTYGNYTEKEISNFQGAVTDQSSSMS
ncbi:MAG: hypothetical protein ABEK04_01215 [Candidatus Nanohalobium sp.]